MNNDKKEVLGKGGIGYKKIAGLSILFILVCIGCWAGITYYFSTQNTTKEKDKQIQKFSGENEKLGNLNKQLEDKLAKLSADYDKVDKDRENIIEQSKRIIQEKNELLNFKKLFEEVTGEKEKLLQEKKQMAAEIEDLSVKIEQTKEKYGKELTEEKEQLRICQEEIVEKDKINESLTKKTDIKKTEANLKILEKENRDLAQSLKEIEGERSDLSKQLEQQKQEYGKNEIASQTRYNELHNMYEELMVKYRKVVQDQKTLQEKLDEFPKKIADLAAQNKGLIKGTADMHYNLGVFYFEKQEYARAVPEFERAMKINSQDADSYYYLGYIYAEHFMKRSQAVEYFNKYLQLAPRGAHADWVKKYLLSWRIWDEKENIE